MTLASQIEALCDQHDLTCLDVAFFRYSNGQRGFTVYAHGDDEVGTSEYREGQTPEQAIAAAIERLNSKRHAVRVPVLETA